MPTFLFLWNPAVDVDSFENYDDLSPQTTIETPYKCSWICPSRRPRPGDRAYVKRTGPNYNGLFTRGWVTSKPYESDDGIRVVDLTLESILPLGKEIGKATLGLAPLSATYWTPQASGTTIQHESAVNLETRWPLEAGTPDRSSLPATAGDTTSGTGGGFGDALSNRIVEEAAVHFVSQHYSDRGYVVHSVEAEKVGYDLKCYKGNEIHHVEVKGTVGDAEMFIITAREHAAAMTDQQFVLGVVTMATSTPRLTLYRAAEIQESFDFKAIQYRGTKKTVRALPPET